MASRFETGAPTVALPEGLALRDLLASEERRGWRDWLGPALAGLLHAAVLAALLWDWRIPLALPDEAPIPVTILFAPPPQPAPQPVPAPEPPIGRESGKDQRTTAPQAADEAGAEATRPPQPQPAPSPAAERPAPTAPAPKAEPRKEAARPDPRKEADKARAPHVAKMPPLLVHPGEREETGDPYLNHARDLIERHRVYPTVIGQFGLPVEGTPVYAVVIDRSGALRSLVVARSSGAAALDDAGAGMIRAAAPFPPVPGAHAGDVYLMTITITLSPP